MIFRKRLTRRAGAVLVAVTALVAGAYDEMVFDLPSGAKESRWRDCLAQALEGSTEVNIPEGRVDVLTDEEAIEVDFQHKWKEGLGQAVVYARSLHRRPVLALITYGENESETTKRTQYLLALAEAHCASNGVRMVVLRPSRNDEFVRKDPTKHGVRPEPPPLRISKSGKRHNPRCKYYREEFAPCGPDEGVPCGACGG